MKCLYKESNNDNTSKFAAINGIRALYIVNLVFSHVVIGAGWTPEFAGTFKMNPYTDKLKLITYIFFFLIQVIFQRLWPNNQVLSLLDM